MIGNTSSEAGGGRQKRLYKLDPKPVPLACHDAPVFEKQWCHRCARCRLPIGYVSRPTPHKGDCTYIFP
ncbi:uncharacterized protein VP01_480g7 [Puccinia sorghi]|uniref:STEEP1 domain-containing protein n=1 Tax=Puccinia sorghi TaxID=27349 RepID=A0A0L6UML5_9BASI|nr:uncharacterized protein VP01_480g7 [Puccinia sorghi]